MGNYKNVLANKKEYLSQGKIINYINEGIEIKCTKYKGRGVFTTKAIKQGDLLVVESAIGAITV